jgi:hypothetical protein
VRRLLLIALVASLVPLAAAQRFGSGGRFGGGFGGHHHGGRYARQYANSFPWLWDSLYADELYTPDYPDYPPQPSVIVMPPAQAPAPQSVPGPESEPAEPLLIELQGNRYVQVSGEEGSTAQMLDRGEASSALQEPSNGTVRLEPVAVLVFRDGHREEVSSYTIAAGVLYAQSDYYVNGTWNRKIDLASLDVAETIRENQSLGIHFQLPRAANEVTVGP